MSTQNLHVSVQRSFIHNGQKLEIMQATINGPIVLGHKRNEVLLHVTMWMNDVDSVPLLPIS